jgi:hypothetical protein
MLQNRSNGIISGNFDKETGDQDVYIDILN